MPRAQRRHDPGAQPRVDDPSAPAGDDPRAPASDDPRALARHDPSAPAGDDPGAPAGDYRRAVAGAIAATTVLSPTSFAWFGVPQPSLPARAEAAMDAVAARAYLLYALQSRLYASFYCLGEAGHHGFDAAPVPRFGPSPFLLALSQANSGAGSHEPGWRVAALDGERVVVERDGLRLWVAPQDLHRGRAAAAEHDALQPGATVGVLMPKELTRLSPGFYMALGDAEFAAGAGGSIVRFYWSLRSDGAALLVGLLTEALNRAGLAFRLKVVADPEGYRRCDAGVLYTLAPQFDLVAPIVAGVQRRIEPWLRSSLPALTKPLAPGLALAEDPGVGSESFGMHRCRLLAEGILDAAAQGAGSVSDTLAIVAARFAGAHISMERPYLGPGSADRYRLPAAPTHAGVAEPTADADANGTAAARPAIPDAADLTGRLADA